MTPSASCGGMALLEDVDELVDGLLRMNGCSSEEGFVVEGIVLAGRTIRGGGDFWVGTGSYGRFRPKSADVDFLWKIWGMPAAKVEERMFRIDLSFCLVSEQPQSISVCAVPGPDRHVT